MINNKKDVRVLFITTIPAPYRVTFFNELGKNCDLTVLFERNESDERDESWSHYSFENFNGIILKGMKTDVDKALSFQVIKYLSSKKYDRFVIHNMATPTGLLAVTYLKLRKIPYIIEGDGGFPKNGKGFRESLKRYLISGAECCLSPNDSFDDYCRTYGAKDEEIVRYPFSSISNADLIDLSEKTIQKIHISEKKTLGINEPKMILTVGQFIHRKGFDTLINVAKKLSDDVGVYFVGGVPTKEYLELANGHKNIHFIGFISPEELKHYYRSADIFVLPTREDIWGLVVNEAMANALPVVTTDRCGAGLELVENGLNGYIVPVDDESELQKSLNSIIDIIDKEVYFEMCSNSLSKIKDYTIETMVDSHVVIF